MIAKLPSCQDYEALKTAFLFVFEQVSYNITQH